MEKKVIFQEGMDVDPADHNNLQTYAQDALDHVVADAITANQRYAGFLVVATGVTTVSVATGRLYQGGKRFAAANPTVQDFIGSLPLAGKKIVTVLASGQEVDTDVTPREFLLNEDTGASEPRAVAITKARVANVVFAQGTESPDPTPPLVDVGYTRIANITLSTSGIAKIEMIGTTAVENLDAIGDRTDALETFESRIGPKLDTLASDLAGLSNQIKAAGNGNLLAQLLQRVAVIEFKDKIPATAVSSYADYFLSTTQIDTANPLSHCKVDEGVRFPDYNASEAALQIFNPLDPNVVIKGGLLMPTYDRKIWVDNSNYGGEAQIAGYSYQTFNMVQKTMSRQRIRYGSPFTVCTNSTFWQSGTFDYFTNTFKRGNETFEVSQDFSQNDLVSYDANGQAIVHDFIRLQQIFVDTVDEPYWDKVTIDHTVNGAQIAETFLQGQDIWLDAVGLFFTRLAATGDATLSICEVTKYGTPNLDAVISHTTLTRAQMSLYPAETVVPVQPTYLKAGKRYAILVTTAADHWVATTPGEDFTTGTFFYVLDGAYAQGDGTRDLMFRLYRASFNANRTVVTLGSLNLAGGILTIDVNADTIAPKSTQVTYEIQPSGSGTWYNLLDVGSYVPGSGGSTPVLCGFRMVLAGDTGMMPAVSLTNSLVRIARPDVTRTEISTAFTLGSASTNIHVIERYEGWDGTHHTASVKLLTGSGYTTSLNPASYVDTLSTDPNGQGVLERHYVFTPGSAVSSYKIRHDATTDTPTICFHTAWMKTYAL